MQLRSSSLGVVVMALAAWAMGSGCGGTTVLPPSAESPTLTPPTSPSSAGSGGSEPAPSSAPKLICDRVIDDFSTAEVGRYPEGWTPRDDDTTELAKVTYRVQMDGDDKVLHAKWQDKTVTIGMPVPDWDMKAYPVLSWRWKAVALPEGADESDGDKNDTGAAVYTSWKVGFPMYVRGIKYAWSSTLKVGTRTKKRMNHDQMLVIESGKANVGQWRDVQVDVRKHATTFFDDEAIRAPDVIALMTDADSTNTSAEAYFADFKLCRWAE